MFHSLIILSRWTVTTPKNKDIFSNTAYGICHITWELCILYKSPYYNILLQSILMMSSLDHFMCVTSTIQNPQSSSGRGGQSVDAMMPRFPVQIYTSSSGQHCAYLILLRRLSQLSPSLIIIHSFTSPLSAGRQKDAKPKLCSLWTGSVLML